MRFIPKLKKLEMLEWFSKTLNNSQRLPEDHLQLQVSVICSRPIMMQDRAY